MITKWDRRYIDLARHIAGWSKDPSTKVGTVLVGRDRRRIAFGYNGFPEGLADTENRLTDRALKHKLTQHAERNALDFAAFDTQGASLITTRFPCSECAKSIVTKKIARVVSPPPPTDVVWADDAVLAREILNECQITVEIYNEHEAS